MIIVSKKVRVVLILLLLLSVYTFWNIRGTKSNSNTADQRRIEHDEEEDKTAVDNTKPTGPNGELNNQLQTVLQSICEEQESTEPPRMVRVEMEVPLTGVNFRNVSTLQQFCSPYIYTRFFMKVGTRITGDCDEQALTRGKDCEWYHMCVWPAEDDVYISKAILQGEMWEENLILIMVTALHKQKPGIVIDAGANIGQYSIAAAAVGHKVVAFEPIPQHVEMIKKSLALNGFSHRAHIFQNGLSDYNTKTFINFHKTNKGGSTIAKIDSTVDETLSDPRFIPGMKIELDLIKLDDVLNLLDVLYPDEKITFWKADIEGYEPRMFRGASKFLATRMPSMIIFEILGKSFERTKCNLPQLLQSLGKLGYTMKSIEGNLLVEELSYESIDSFSSMLISKKESRDILLINKEDEDIIGHLFLPVEQTD